MKVVDDGNLLMPPHCCGLTRRSDGLIIDFGQEIACTEPPHLYLHESVIREAAELLGYVPKEKVEELTSQVSTMGDELQQLHDYLKASEEANRLKEAMA